MLTTVDIGGGRYALIDAPTMDIARMVASACGYFDVDVEPMEPGRVVVRATSAKRTVSFSGTTANVACIKLINALSGDG